MNFIRKDIKLKNISIELTFNDSRRVYSEFMMYQLLDTLDEEYNIDFYIVTSGVTDFSFTDRLKKLFPNKVRQFYIKDFDEYLKTVTFKKIPVDTTHYYANMLLPRFYMFDMFPKLKRYIHLEEDMLVRRSISEVWEYNKKSPLLACADMRQVQSEDFPHRDCVKKYNMTRWFNNGMFVMNLDYFRENDVYNKLYDIIVENKLNWLVDEYSFNIYYKDIFNSFEDDRWNCFDWEHTNVNKDDICIYHWVSCSNQNKPWNTPSFFSRNPFVKEWCVKFNIYKNNNLR